MQQVRQVQPFSEYLHLDKSSIHPYLKIHMFKHCIYMKCKYYVLLSVTHSGTSFTSFFKKREFIFIYLCFTVQKKLAACVNIIPGIISVYEWQDKIENDDEVLMMIKTRTSRIPGTFKILLISI